MHRLEIKGVPVRGHQRLGDPAIPTERPLGGWFRREMPQILGDALYGGGDRFPGQGDSGILGCAGQLPVAAFHGMRPMRPIRDDPHGTRVSAQGELHI